MPARNAHEEKIFKKVFGISKRKYGTKRAYAIATAAVMKYRKRKKGR